MPLIPKEQFRRNEALPQAGETVTQIQFLLEGHFEALAVAGARPYIKKGTERIQTGVYPVIPEEFGRGADRIWNERSSRGHIASLALRRKSGRVTLAEVSGTLDPSLSKEKARGLWTADEWAARLEFPTPEEGQDPRAVLDIWRTPLTDVVRLGNRIDFRDKEQMTAYDEFLSNATSRKKDSSNIPPGAIDRHHIVLGQPEGLDPEDQARVVQVLGLFDQAASEVIAWENQTTLEILKEKG
ncbi:hypothetical protein HYS42_00965 [Candidatus Saccharibacteria bacterium]|nr:hypothetical protein [Candidatus Saccharibacteria bacterium]